MQLKFITVFFQFPFLGAAVGIVLSTLFVVGDFIVQGTNSYVAHPLLKVLVIVAVSLVGYGCASLYRTYTESLKDSLLQPPIDLFGLDNDTDNVDHLHKD